MKDRMAVRAARWNSLSASGERMLRSIPTIAPTKALTSTRRENWARLARRPSRTVAVGSGSMGLLTRPLVRLAEIEAQHLLHLRGFREHVGQSADELLAIERQHRVPPLLEGDGARGLAAHPRPAGGPREVPRKDLHVAGEAEQFRVKTVVELARVLPRLAGEVGTAHGPDEQRVPGQDEPGLGPAPKIRHDERHALGRVTGSVQH